MNRFYIAILLALVSCTNAETKKGIITEIHYPSSVIPSNPCIEFNLLNDKIRDGLISKEKALKAIRVLLPQIRSYFYNHNGKDYGNEDRVFPVQGYNTNAMGGINGSGYIDSQYDYFDGNKHRGHPAHDIFIIDNNQDFIDDVTKKKVNVLSMTEGIVIGTENKWDTTSNLRGGKYIWIYAPSINSFFYYAHNSNVLVSLGNIVKPGDVIATVGRTGFSAFKKHSPTHLHIMQLKLDDNFYPKPVNCFKVLKGAKVIQ